MTEINKPSTKKALSGFGFAMANAMPDDEWVKFNMKLRPEMAEKLDDEARRVGISRAALMRVIIDQYYQATEKDES